MFSIIQDVLDFLKWSAFAGNKFSFVQLIWLIFVRVENIDGKGENGG